MSERSYLCRVIGTGRSPGTLSEFDPGDLFRAEIRDDLVTSGERYSLDMIDLRTFEEWRDKAGGWCLAIIEANEVIHAQLALQYSAPSNDKATLDSVIGSEATDEPFDSANVLDYLRRVHTRRMARLVREKPMQLVRKKP